MKKNIWSVPSILVLIVMLIWILIQPGTLPDLVLKSVIGMVALTGFLLSTRKEKTC